jgi:RNA polymerase primary sigma factor
MRSNREFDDDLILKGIRRIPALKRADNVALAHLILKGGAEGLRARDQMVAGNMRLVLHIARKYPDGTLNLHDRIQEGAMGLLRAINKFDPERGISFATYAIYWIRAHIERAVSANEYTIHVPANVAFAIRRLRRAEAAADQPLTDDETEEILALGPNIVQAVKRMPHTIVPIDAPIASDPDGQIMADIVPDQSIEDPEEAVLRSGLWQFLSVDCGLPDRDLTMLGLFACGETYQSMGEMYGVSRERARQIVVDAIKIVQRKVGRHGFSEVVTCPK